MIDNLSMKLQEQFEILKNSDKQLSKLRQIAFDAFATLGIPTTRHEEWKYTNVKAKLQANIS